MEPIRASRQRWQWYASIALLCVPFDCLGGQTASSRNVRIKSARTEDESGGSSRSLYLALDGGTQALYWHPGIKTEAVNYNAEGLAAYKAEAVLGYGSPIVSLSYERPFAPSSSRQRDMFVSNKTQNAGLEKYTAGLDVLPVITYLFPAVGSSELLKILFSAEILHSETVFYGNANVAAPVFFLPSNAVVDYNARTVSGAQKLEAGSHLAFRTMFTEDDISLGLLRYETVTFRIGYFDLRWKRPSDNNNSYHITDGGSSFPILYETTYQAKGLLFMLTPNDPYSPGWSLPLEVRYGTKNSLHAALEQQLPSYESLHFLGLKAGLWYNLYLRPKDKRGLFFSMGADYDYRSWTIQAQDAAGNEIVVKTVDEERLYSLFARVGYRF